jgi:hypothetical protein
MINKDGLRKRGVYQTYGKKTLYYPDISATKFSNSVFNTQGNHLFLDDAFEKKQDNTLKDPLYLLPKKATKFTADQFSLIDKSEDVISKFDLQIADKKKTQELKQMQIALKAGEQLKKLKSDDDIAKLIKEQKELESLEAAASSSAAAAASSSATAAQVVPFSEQPFTTSQIDQIYEEIKNLNENGTKDYLTANYGTLTQFWKRIGINEPKPNKWRLAIHAFKKKYGPILPSSTAGIGR